MLNFAQAVFIPINTLILCATAGNEVCRYLQSGTYHQMHYGGELWAAFSLLPRTVSLASYQPTQVENSSVFYSLEHVHELSINISTEAFLIKCCMINGLCCIPSCCM